MEEWSFSMVPQGQVKLLSAVRSLKNWRSACPKRKQLVNVADLQIPQWRTPCRNQLALTLLQVVQRER